MPLHSSLIITCGNQVPRLGIILIYGGETLVKAENKDVCILSDSVLSSLYSLCVNEHTSAIKVSAFVQAFMLPKLNGAEGGNKTSSQQRVSSRTIISLVSTLARDRPTDL